MHVRLRVYVCAFVCMYVCLNGPMRNGDVDVSTSSLYGIITNSAKVKIPWLGSDVNARTEEILATSINPVDHCVKRDVSDKRLQDLHVERSQFMAALFKLISPNSHSHLVQRQQSLEENTKAMELMRPFWLLLASIYLSMSNSAYFYTFIYFHSFQPFLWFSLLNINLLIPMVLSFFLSFFLSFYSSAYLFLHLCLSVRLYHCVLIYLSIHLSISLCLPIIICLIQFMAIYLSTFVYFKPFSFLLFLSKYLSITIVIHTSSTSFFLFSFLSFFLSFFLSKYLCISLDSVRV